MKSGYTEIPSGSGEDKQSFMIRMIKWIALYSIVIWSVILLFVVAHRLATTKNAFCDGAPYIYATFHDQIPNVVKYSRNGCLLDENVLVGFPKYHKKKHFMEPRGLAWSTYKNETALFVADAYSEDSYLTVYSECDKKGHRKFITTAISTQNNPGVDHIYGISFDQDGNLYATSQHTDNVLRFYKDSFHPMPIPPQAMQSTNPDKFPSFPGTFVQFGEANIHAVSQQGVRDITSVNGKMWIANEDTDSVIIVDSISGRVEESIPIIQPIGLHYCAHHQLVFVSSKEAHANGQVFAISSTTFEIVRSYHSKKMTHPTGITSHQNLLYVANQKRGQVVTFEILTGAFKRTIIKKMPKGIEQITLSPC